MFFSNCKHLITRTRHGLILLLIGCILIILSITGVFASNDDCVDDRRLRLMTEERYPELEAEFKAELNQPGVKTNYARRACLQTFLGSVQSRQEKTQEALSNLNKAVNIAAKYLPEDHLDALNARLHLASTLGHSGDRGSQIRILIELLPLYERKFGKQHLSVVTVLRNLATAYVWVGT
jgi:hypothetical protein